MGIFEDIGKRIDDMRKQLESELRSEIEELKSRRCSNCQYWMQLYKDLGGCSNLYPFVEAVTTGKFESFETQSDFGCNQWEGK